MGVGNETICIRRQQLSATQSPFSFYIIYAILIYFSFFLLVIFLERASSFYFFNGRIFDTLIKDETLTLKRMDLSSFSSFLV